MPQNRDTGARANQFGREAAVKIAQHLKLNKLSKTSNEVIYKNKRAVIKSARRKNLSVGVTLKMLKKLDLIIAAFETDKGKYDLYTLDAKTYRTNYRVDFCEVLGLVRKKVFLEEGKFLKTLKL